MDDIFSWFTTLLNTPSSIQTVIVISMCAGLGLMLGKINIGKVSLGVTFVFFVGILLSHIGINCDEAVLSFSQSFGLILFIYALGLEVGPSFFPSLKRHGIVYNIYSIILIGLSLVMVVVFKYSFGIPIQNILGILSGAVTNTPVLAAIQSSMHGCGMDNAKNLSDVALACAVTYPMGVVGVILAIMLLNALKPKKIKKTFNDKPFISEFEITNEDIHNTSLRDVVIESKKKFIISRIWRDGHTIIPCSQTILKSGDHLLVLSKEEDADNLESFFGKRVSEHDWNRADIDWNTIDSTLSSKRIIITKNKFNGVKLGALRLRNEYGITITRIDRAGIELLASPELYLQLGDRITVVGDSKSLSKVSELLGDTISMLDKPKLIGFFWGMCLGCIIGSIPIFIPGMSVPIKLGLAGGPIIVGILMGAFGPRLRITTYITNSATQLIKQIGIITYLASLGLSSGSNFVETIMQGDGLIWIFMGFSITTIPTIIVGIICSKIRKMNFGETTGILCGSMANPMALDYAQSITQDKYCSVAYASVYPISMFLRIITAQIIFMLFV